jgi:hypothetical protein
MTKIIILSISKSSSSLYYIDVLKIKQDSEFYRNIAAKFTSQTASFPLLLIKLNEEAKLINKM